MRETERERQRATERDRVRQRDRETERKGEMEEEEGGERGGGGGLALWGTHLPRHHAVTADEHLRAVNVTPLVTVLPALAPHNTRQFSMHGGQDNVHCSSMVFPVCPAYPGP